MAGFGRRLSLDVLVLVTMLASGAPTWAQTAVSICGQIASGDAYLTNDVECAPNAFAAVILEGGSLDLRGYTIRGAEVGVLCARPIWEESIFIYLKCRVFGGTVADYGYFGLVAKKFDLSDLTVTGGHGAAVTVHKQLRFTNLTLELAPEPQNIGLYGPRTPTMKGSNLTATGGAYVVRGGNVDIDGLSASGYTDVGVYGSKVRLWNASLAGGINGVLGGYKATIEGSTITGHSEAGVQARRIRLVGAAVTGNAVDLHAEHPPILKEGAVCDTSNGWGVCSGD